MTTSNQTDSRGPAKRTGISKSGDADPRRNGGMFDDTQIDEGDDVEEPSRDLGRDGGDVERAGEDRGGAGVATD